MNQPLAYIHPDAKIDPSVKIGPFVTIEKNVEIGADTKIDANAVICEGTRIGKNCHIFPGAVLGEIPQDLKFKGEDTLAVIGDNCNIREFVTIHRGTASRGKTVIGNNNLIMAYCHVGHDCVMGNNIIMSNGVQLAGEVEVDDNAVIGGGALFHQFTHVGSNVMVQGGIKVTKDIPPYITAGRDPIVYAGINSVGLHRSGFSNEQIENIKDIYRIIYQLGLNTTQAVEKIEAEFAASKEKEDIILFIKNSQRGIVKSK